MDTVDLGGLTVSAQGLGCMGMSEWYGPADWDQSIATISRALDLGVTFLDTADVYGQGHNEVLVGRGIAGRRDEVQLATKFGIDRSGGDRDRRIRGARAFVKRSCEASLVRLGVETIDLYYAAPPAAGRRDRGDGRRDGRAGAGGQGALPRPVGGDRGPAAPRRRRAPDRGAAERVLAVGPRPGAARAGARRARRRAGALLPARARLPDRHDRPVGPGAEGLPRPQPPLRR